MVCSLCFQHVANVIYCVYASHAWFTCALVDVTTISVAQNSIAATNVVEHMVFLEMAVLLTEGTLRTYCGYTIGSITEHAPRG